MAARQIGIVVNGAVQPELRRLFAEPLARALEGLPGSYSIELGPGRRPDEVIVVLHASHRRAPLPLFFPRAHSLEAGDVSRIVRNVIEGMGPAFGSA